ncbi:MAG: (E)-4-hydroxy-3-methylbut-2-enyl-diphosphate synthase [Simkania negevensis]|nr:(E)-4-hydroxy-3-methylbut-2-enyl-diphosphate synthase [Simkania negevensis]
MRYCLSVSQTKRWKTREVMVGNVGVGGTNPIRIQSMTTSDTRDVEVTADQIMRLSDVGCEIARVTVQGKKEAEACEGIKNLLVQKGYTIPLVADIHFYPPAAMLVVDFVDKVRINPGNFVDKRAIFKTIEYDDASYEKETQKIEETFAPLVKKCLRLKRAMRIGTNHGSLSDRIMNRYGDTSFGMVESALEFARVCRKYDYHDFMFSMKASNPLVMIQAYRLLVAEMIKLDWDYPLHLGVTEAGDGEDGRIKSAVGTGTLLLDGLGDTIRVSLTEDPWEEIDPCKRFLSLAKSYEGKGIHPFVEKYRNISKIQRRYVRQDETKTLHRDGSVLLSLESSDLEKEDLLESLGCVKKEETWVKGDQTVDAILIEHLDQTKDTFEVLATLAELNIPVITRSSLPSTFPLQNVEELGESPSVAFIKDGSPDTWKALLEHPVHFIILHMTGSMLHQGRYFFDWMVQSKLDLPVLLLADYQLPPQDMLIHAAAECGALLSDGFGEGVVLRAQGIDKKEVRSISFGILQAARMRASKTEFIACPGCGRTLFDLQTVTQRIRSKTSHLPGVKIAIMGCVVNGPGEMADADFGYVGARSGKVDLYVGKTCVEKNIDFSEADEKLIDLIKSHGRWVEREKKRTPALTVV